MLKRPLPVFCEIVMAFGKSSFCNFARYFEISLFWKKNSIKYEIITTFFFPTFAILHHAMLSLKHVVASVMLWKNC